MGRGDIIYLVPRIHFLPDELTAEVAIEETILRVSLRYGIPHAHACGGHARCSTCRVSIVEGLESCAPRNAAEQTLAERLHFSPEIRLACQTLVRGDVRLRRLVLDEEDIELTSQLTETPTIQSIGEEKEIAILFADIRGFTSFSEALPPYDVVHILNRYFDIMGKAIQRHHGCIDNYMGDGLIALFGTDDPTDSALNAVRAGLDMVAAMQQLEPYLRSVYHKTFHIGIGVHYGEAVVGEIGAPGGRRTTAIGDSVNLASRVESATREASVPFLVSEAVCRNIGPRLRVGKTISLPLKGKTGEYTLHEVIGLD